MMIISGFRRIFLCDSGSFGGIEASLKTENYALLLPASTIMEVDLSLSFASQAVHQGCREVCCVGQFAGVLEDALDAMLEVDEELEVATSALLVESEGVEYFLYAVGGGDPEMDLLALVESGSTLKNALVSQIR